MTDWRVNVRAIRVRRPDCKRRSRSGCQRTERGGPAAASETALENGRGEQLWRTGRLWKTGRSLRAVRFPCARVGTRVPKEAGEKPSCLRATGKGRFASLPKQGFLRHAVSGRTVCGVCRRLRSVFMRRPLTGKPGMEIRTGMRRIGAAGSQVSHPLRPQTPDAKRYMPADIRFAPSRRQGGIREKCQRADVLPILACLKGSRERQGAFHPASGRFGLSNAGVPVRGQALVRHRACRFAGAGPETADRNVRARLPFFAAWARLPACACIFPAFLRTCRFRKTAPGPVRLLPHKAGLRNKDLQKMGRKNGRSALQWANFIRSLTGLPCCSWRSLI